MHAIDMDSAGEFVGVPFGSRARLILLYLQTQALRSRSREVELGRSMREWLRRMGIAPAKFNHCAGHVGIKR
jgi:hypothetical protein